MNTRDLHSTLTQLWDYRWKKKNTRNIIWDMTLTICYICFNKQQVQQLIHNDKTTMSSLYPLVCAFLLECSFASNICFHTSHTLQQTFIWIYIYIYPLHFPCPKGCSLSVDSEKVWSHLTLDLLKALLTSCDHSDLFSARDGHGWVYEKTWLKYVSSTCNIYTYTITYIYILTISTVVSGMWN